MIFKNKSYPMPKARLGCPLIVVGGMLGVKKCKIQIAIFMILQLTIPNGRHALSGIRHRICTSSAKLEFVEEFSMVLKVPHEGQRSEAVDPAGKIIPVRSDPTDSAARTVRHRSPAEKQTELISRCRPDGCLTFANRAFCLYFGKSSEELIGVSLLTLVLREDRSRVEAHLASLTPDHPMAAIKHRVMLPNGEIRWHQRTDQGLFDPQGRMIGFQSVSRDLNRLVQTQKTLRKSKEHYQSLISKMGNAFALVEFIFDAPKRIRDCRFIEVNPAFERITGMPAAKVIQQLAGKIFPGTEKFWLEHCGQVAITGEPRHLKQYSKLFNSFFEVVAYSPQKGQVAVVFTDITPRVQTENALRESENNFKAIAENANDGILITLADGREAYVNRHVCELAGYSESELHQIGFYGLVHPDEKDIIYKRNNLRFKGAPVPNRYETLLVKKDGGKVPVEVTASKTIWRGQPAVLQIIRDITLRKRLEEALGKINIELERRVQERNDELVQIAEKLEKKHRELLEHKTDLEKANKELVQTNTALSVLARNINKKRDEAEKRMAQTISSQIIPLIEDIKTHKIPEKSRANLEMLGAYLNDLTDGAGKGHAVIISLSTMELRVAMMIKNGFTSEEIARVLHISPHTVKTHRRSIRKKLKIKNEDVSLASFLKSKLGRSSATTPDTPQIDGQLSS
jgi:PAS domain S-box-containing protein